MGSAILVVDHDYAARTAEVVVACRLGLPVQEAESAETARAQLQGWQAVLAIVEVELPGPTNGLEFLRELHDTHGERVPIILVSANRTAPIDARPDCSSGLTTTSRSRSTTASCWRVCGDRWVAPKGAPRTARGGRLLKGAHPSARVSSKS